MSDADAADPSFLPIAGPPMVALVLAIAPSILRVPFRGAR
jgi:hypothetical protein